MLKLSIEEMREMIKRKYGGHKTLGKRHVDTELILFNILDRLEELEMQASRTSAPIEKETSKEPAKKAGSTKEGEEG